MCSEINVSPCYNLRPKALNECWQKQGGHVRDLSEGIFLFTAASSETLVAGLPSRLPLKMWKTKGRKCSADREGWRRDNIYTTNIIVYFLFNFNPTIFNVSILKWNMHLIFKWRKFNIKSKLLKKRMMGKTQIQWSNTVLYCTWCLVLLRFNKTCHMDSYAFIVGLYCNFCHNSLDFYEASIFFNSCSTLKCITKSLMPQVTTDTCVH